MGAPDHRPPSTDPEVTITAATATVAATTVLDQQVETLLAAIPWLRARETHVVARA